MLSLISSYYLVGRPHVCPGHHSGNTWPGDTRSSVEVVIAVRVHSMEPIHYSVIFTSRDIVASIYRCDVQLDATDLWQGENILN